MERKVITVNKYQVDYDVLIGNKWFQGELYCDSTKIDVDFIEKTTDKIKEAIGKFFNMEDIIVALQNIKIIGTEQIKLTEEETIEYNNVCAEQDFNTNFLNAIKNIRKGKDN